MKKLFLSSTLLLLLACLSFAQPDSAQAEQFRDELSQFLARRAEYPERAAENNTSGDVILSRSIDQAGKLSDPLVVKSSDNQLTLGALKVMKDLTASWNYSGVSCLKPDTNYLFVFRYRTYLNVIPESPKTRAMKLFEEQKYDKALKAFDKAIKENQYDHELFACRAECKRNLGDSEGARKDDAIAENLNNKILAVVDVIRLGVNNTRTVISGEKIIAVPANIQRQ